MEYTRAETQTGYSAPRHQPVMSDHKQFAIDHMNKDHVLALYDYVNAYAGQHLDFFDQPNTQLKLTDVTLNKLCLEWKVKGVKKAAEIPIEPPMTDLSQLRPTVVAMAQDAAGKLGVSPYQVKNYRHWDNVVDFTIDVLFWALMLISVNKPKLSQYHNNPLFSFLDAHAGKLAVATLACHVVEIFFVQIPLLRKYRVPSPAFWKWVIAPLSGGIFAIKRFQRQIPQHKKN